MSELDGHTLELLGRFGHSGFRPGQREAVEAALSGRDVLGVMPTGAGKSLCYQLPALAAGGLTLVISPLVALMEDQIRSLERVAPGEVAAVHGLRDPEDNDRSLDDAASGRLRLLYLAPERLANVRTAKAIQSAQLERVVVDEAHCVSSWGHDFRPEYFRLGEAARRLGATSISAFTATATPRVAKDIAVRLGLDSPAMVGTGFDRPNISFAVVTCEGSADEESRLIEALSDPASRPAIVYAGTRKQTDALAPLLSSKLGVRAEGYHAGLARDDRGAIQGRFMDDETEIVVATNAFGMGVDKPDVRTVVHVAVPGSLEAVYQEAGRAGRDGLASKALLLAEPRDRSLHVHFIKSATVEDSQLKAVVDLLARSVGEDGIARVASRDVAAACGGGAERATAAIGHLAFAEVLAPVPAPPGEIAARLAGELDGVAMAKARAAARTAEQLRWQRYREVWGFVDSEDCRRGALLKYFGDTREPASIGACCDRCDPSLVPVGKPGVAGRKPKERKSGEARAASRASLSAEELEALEAAIVETVRDAKPQVGRTRLVEVLRGSRSKALVGSGQDSLPHYAAFERFGKDPVLAVIDSMLERGDLVSTGGQYPKVKLP
ncbi:MAG: RecQ family ATP-dependent DNA helicase [Actinomycetes bacterium]